MPVKDQVRDIFVGDVPAMECNECFMIRYTMIIKDEEISTNCKSFVQIVLKKPLIKFTD